MREKIYRFMQGRYGVDQLYRFIFFLAIVLMLINNFLKNPMLNLVIYALLILDIFRMLSKNHSARYAENQKYLQLTARFRYRLDQQKKLWQAMKETCGEKTVVLKNQRQLDGFLEFLSGQKDPTEFP